MHNYNMVTIDSVNIKGLRKTHFEQLLAYIYNREEDQWYYGSKKQFEKRHEEIKIWLEEIVKMLDDPEIKITNK